MWRGVTAQSCHTGSTTWRHAGAGTPERVAGQRHPGIDVSVSWGSQEEPCDVEPSGFVFQNPPKSLPLLDALFLKIVVGMRHGVVDQGGRIVDPPGEPSRSVPDVLLSIKEKGKTVGWSSIKGRTSCGWSPGRIFTPSHVKSLVTPPCGGWSTLTFSPLYENGCTTLTLKDLTDPVPRFVRVNGMV